MLYVILVNILIFSSMMMYGGVLIVEGKYQNKNIYVQNSYGVSGVGFCVVAVYVNGKLTNDEIHSTAFEIDLSQFKLRYGQEVTIKIVHKDGCPPPRVLNPDALHPIPTFEIIAISMTPDGLLKW
ncbi:MAG: hypothetical protein NZM44_04625, partial [Candidatus Calescibacterium sp.]|nr:hypothetical protein [Candidatus Calescibacterium sp.]